MCVTTTSPFHWSSWWLGSSLLFKNPTQQQEPDIEIKKEWRGGTDNEFP